MKDYPHPENPGQTHYEGCWKRLRHHNCAVARVYELEKGRRVMNLTGIKLHKKEEGFVSRDQVEWLIREIERLTQQVGLEARTIDSIILKTQEKTSAASAEELGQLRDELKETRKQGTERDIEAICEFIKAYERKKYQIMHEGGKLLSPVDFMLDYCGDIRRKAEEL